MIENRIKIAICDDEKVILEHLQKLITDIFTKCGIPVYINCFLTGKSFLASTVEYDFIFMDIELQGENGLEILKQYRNRHETIFVILTSHAEEMAKGYFVRAFRFLVKPLNQELLKESIYSGLDVLRSSLRFSVTDENENILLIKSKDIVYFEGGDRKSGVKTLKNFYILHKTLKEIRPLLDTQFYPVHRSYIINMNYIDRIDGLTVFMTDGSIINISRLKRGDFNEKFYDFIRRKTWNDSI